MTAPEQEGGYGCPPAQHRFQKGQSGNPRGRPPRKREAQQAARRTTDDIWIKEASRELTFKADRPGCKAEAMEFLIRSIMALALKGDPGAQKIVLREIKEAQKRTEEAERAFLRKMVDYQHRSWRQLQQCQLEHRPAPELTPHPDDIVIDILAGTVSFNGPSTAAEKVEWDQQFAIRAAAQEELGQLRATRPRGANKAAHEQCIQDEQDRINYVNRTYPDERIRRAVGFDLKVWRAKEIEASKSQRARATAAGALTVQAPAAAPHGGSLPRQSSTRRKAGT